MTAVRLGEYVWLVGTADDRSPAFTSPYDGNQYLIWDGERGVLLDAGTGLGADSWFANVESVAAADAIYLVLISHYHGDHAGGAAAAAAHGWPVAAGEVTAAAIAAGDEAVTQVARARELGIYPPQFSLRAQASERILADGESIDVGTVRVTSLATPGHCDGHFVFLADGPAGLALFTGDVLFAGGLVSLQAIPDCRLDRYAESVMRLAELGIDQLFPGHGDPVLCEAHRDVTSAADSFARLIPPRNFLNP
ncbi:MBL fold metallo-hydrolase [Microbacterium sp. zg-Y818]|uniref:MBL fold metallo-hydrolase n=1 Tax=unclassified Microbacterium TaxID=2609290 RepID=UPI00214CE068|nr:MULTISPECIES: MBL fold metallo-hydrolase [unclassified Microbacterium]MCR2800221.1 MBL fold metallo-hydrolase [Microbacterium sp. zg.Y818]WIM22188.1 MBL fold metallo-hydrolase [Microbacterium sp. zg-Y818]